jgi:uncharacterized peroxidase-related enzyme
MARIEPNQNPAPEAQKLLDGVKAKLGKVPNIFQTFAHSPAVLESYLNFSGALGKSSISAALREQIALTVAGANQCDYCASAHTAIGKSLKIDDAELTQNLSGKASDKKVQAALTFVRKSVDQRGKVGDADVQALRDAGYDDAAIVEIVATIAINLFTNYFNHIVGTEVDFPAISTASIAKAA